MTLRGIFKNGVNIGSSESQSNGFQNMSSNPLAYLAETMSLY